MNRRIHLSALVVGGILGLAGPAQGQFYPGYGYGGWGGENGAAALLGSDQRDISAMQLKAQSMQFGQQRTMAQNAMVQGGIRNMQYSQAQSQTNAINAQQQATQDWWFQQQSQQMAQRQAREQYGTQPISPGIAPAGGPPPAAMDIIQWPTVLQDQCFATERAKIEAPYRRSPPKLSIPTLADYRQMAGTVEDMKAVLEWKLREGIATADYETAKAFLNRLGADVANRVQVSAS